MSHEARWLARELRPVPARRPGLFRRFVGWLVRHLPELVAVGLVVYGWASLARVVGQLWTAVLVGGLVVGLLAWSRSRRVLSAGLGCLVTRYRLRAALIELRLTTRSGRLPVVLWIKPTPVGERVWVCLRVGISAEDLADETDRLRSACFAREVRITRDPRLSALVSLDVVRRDPLASSATVPHPFAAELDAAADREGAEHG